MDRDDRSPASTTRTTRAPVPSASLEIFGDNRIEADWFRSLSPLLQGARFTRIAGRGRNPGSVETLIRYDRPDIILLAGDRPVLVLEKTREVPTGHNVGQRMARLVRAVEEQVFTIFFAPYRAMKHGTHANECQLNIRVLQAFARMAEIHDTPVVSVEWPADGAGELVIDGTENGEIARLVHGFLAARFDRGCVDVRQAQSRMKDEYDRRLRVRASYGELPDSVAIVETEKLLRAHGLRVHGDPALLRTRKETLVYTADMTPLNCKRQDPYTGMQFIYDYIECRSGRGVHEKKKNLALRFPRIDRAHWWKQNPNDPSTKSCNWYLTANALIFSDGIDVLR